MLIRVAPSIAFLAYAIGFALVVNAGIAIYRAVFEQSK